MGEIILLVLGVVLLLFTLRGYHRGFLKSMLSMFSLVISILFAGFAQPYVVEAIKSYTPLYDIMCETVADKMEDAAKDALTPAEMEESSLESGTGGSLVWTEAEQASILQEFQLPDIFTPQLLAGGARPAEAFTRSASEYIVDLALNIISTLFLFLISSFVIQALFVAFDIVGRIPVVHGVNKWLGAGLGFLQGAFVIWVFFLIITFLLPFIGHSELMEAIQANDILSLLYDGCLSLGQPL